MNKQEAFRLPAVDFMLDEKEGFQTVQRGETRYGEKEALKNQLLAKVMQNDFDQIIKTAHHSYTFLPKKKDNREKMPIRVHLSSTDLKRSGDGRSNEEYFDNLILSCKAQRKVAGVKRLLIGAGAAAILTAGVATLMVGMNYAWEKETEYQNQRNAPYVDMQEQQQRQEEAQKWFEEQKRIEGEQQQEIVNQVTGASSDIEYQSHK